jgi:nitrate reductase NapAB chaperone NapD
MSVATKYNVQIAWRTLASQVFQLTRADVDNPATYRVYVSVIDSNNPGAGQKEIGYFAVDYYGVPYSIIGTAAGYVDVQDDFRVGRCPTSGRMAVIYQTVYNGRALILGQVDFRFLHPLAFSNYQQYANAVIWCNDPNAKNIPFTALDIPIIINYQDDQVDPEDATKTINYAELYGNDPIPQVRCIVVVDANTEYQLQQMPQITKVDGLINTIWFYPGEVISGRMIISRS